MQIQNLSLTHALFLPIATRAGVTVPPGMSMGLDEQYRYEPAISSAVNGGLAKIVEEPRDEIRVIDLESYGPQEIDLVSAPSTVVIAHDLGYTPLVQVVDEEGVVVPALSCKHVEKTVELTLPHALFSGKILLR